MESNDFMVTYSNLQVKGISSQLRDLWDGARLSQKFKLSQPTALVQLDTKRKHPHPMAIYYNNRNTEGELMSKVLEGNKSTWLQEVFYRSIQMRWPLNRPKEKNIP